MENVGYAALQVIPSFDGMQANLERGMGGPLLGAGASGGRKYGDAAGRSMMATFGGYGRRAGLLAAGGIGLAGAAAFKLAKDSIGLASDLNESINAVNVSYGEQAEGVKLLGEQAAESLGLSNTEFNGLAVQFSSFATTIGGEGAKVVGTLDDLTTRASDFASVMNLDVAEAAGLFQSGLAGETEPLRRYGIDLSAAAVEAHALATGIADGTGEMTEAEKVQARYSLLMKQTAQTAGDFASTSDELANQQRILGARWDDARAKLGTALLPIMKDAVGFLNREGIPAFERFADWFSGDGLDGIERFVDDMRPLANEVGPAAASAIRDIADFLGDAAPYAADLVGAFNDMPDWAKKGLVAGGLGLGVGSKFGLIGRGSGSSGGLGGLLGGVSKAAPLPVFVTNPGIGLGGPGGGKPGAPVPVPGGGPGSPTGGGKGGWLSRLGTGLSSFLPVLPGVAGAGAEALEAGGLKPLDLDAAMEYDAWFKRMTSSAEGMNKATRDLIGGTSDYAMQIKGLPRELVTKFVAPGLVENRRDALQLVKQYDLTPKQKETLFRTAGIPQARRETEGVLGLYRQANQTYTGDVRVNTGDSEARLLRILNLANSINRLGAISVATGGAVPAPSGRTAAPPTPRPRPAPSGGVYKDLERFVDDRVATHRDLGDERGRAGGIRQ